LYPVPSVSWESITTAGTAAHALEAQKARPKTGKQNIFNLDGRYFGWNSDGISDMAMALLYNFCSVTPSLRGG
jgi:glutamate-1-semialdehyde aminotransferase